MKAYPAETTEAFLDGHVSAFALLGGVPQSIRYDNTKLAVARILGDGRRKRTRAFTELQSHYLFEDRFGRPGKGNDKGKVEGMVGYARRNFLVPVPRVESFEALNAHLEQRCLERMDATLRGYTETIGQRMERDLDALLPLPAVPYDAGDKQPSRVSSLSLVRYRTNDYSVPVAYGHRDVLDRGYVDQVVISSGAEVIARHPRSYEQDDFVFDPIHYLPLLERKTAALDQAAPLQEWDLPEEYQTLRRLLEARMGKRGKREFVPVLRLLENFSHQEVHHAVKDALRLGAISSDAVKHLLLCRIEGRPPRLDLDLYPYLPRVSVQTTRCPASTIFAGWRQSVLPVHLLGLAPLLGCVGAVAGDVKLQDDGVMDHPVNRRSGGHGVGKGLHDALAEVHQSYARGDAVDESEVPGLVHRHLLLRYVDDETKARMEDLATTILTDYLHDNAVSLQQVQFAERNIAVHMDGGITIKGRVDLIRRDADGRISIVDLKSNHRSQADEVTKDQLSTYASATGS